ncbi:MAG: hypothetical protein H6R01_1777 [Burkholderiaceae bacterium]|nr:hypothetical protein [Burkholderiaceae bacterium]
MKIKKFFIFSVLGFSALSASGQSTSKFEALVSPEQVFKKNSTVWKAYGEKESDVLDHSNEYYLIAAKRADGFMLVMKKTPSYSNPKKPIYTGYFIKCGVMEDYPALLTNAEELKEIINNPQTQIKAKFRMPFDKDTGMHDTYVRVCHK